jgi:predicted dehydrogenase
MEEIEHALGGTPQATDAGSTSPSNGAAPVIGVGVIGLSARGGWGAGAHLPAMGAAGGFELRGFVGSDAHAARATSNAVGVPAFPTPEDLARADGIDLVVVTVKTPDHRELVLQAAPARKPMFVEWPFAVGLAEAEEMTAAADGVPTYVGLQGRSSPTLRWAADLVREGYVGDVLSATVSSTASEWGGPTSERMRYTLDGELGASMLGIAFGHAIDAVAMIVGELQDVVASTAVRHPLVPLGRTGRMVEMTGVDQIAVSGMLPGGGVLSVHQRGGTASGPSFSMVIDGTEGTLQLSASNHPHVVPVTVYGARRGRRFEQLALPDGYDSFPELASTPIHSLAHAYANIRRSFVGEQQPVPDFAAAVQRHRVMDAVMRSAATGRRIAL